MPSTHRCRRAILPRYLPVQPVAMKKIGPTTGPAMFSSARKTAASSECRKHPTGMSKVSKKNWPVFDTGRLLFDDHFTTKTKGGLVVYYVSPGKGKVKSFLPVRALRSLQPHGRCPVDSNWIGLPHAHRRRRKERDGTDRHEVADLLPLLHGARFQGRYSRALR